MFSWFRRKSARKADVDVNAKAANPGVCAKANVSFSNAERDWTEEVDLVESARKVLTTHGHRVDVHDESLELPESGLVVRPRLVELQPTDGGGVRTVTTIEVSHPGLFPDGLFEYQHSVGENSEDSVCKGIDQWAQVDLVTLIEALKDRPEKCTMMELEFPESDGRPARRRRAVLGPVAHYAQNPPAPAEGTCPAEGEEHPFCPCCLLTNSFMAFAPYVEADGFYGIRLFAARDEKKQPMADCRVNGGDFEPGAEALRQYARGWPPAGYEFRKQYVVLRTVPAAPAGDA